MEYALSVRQSGTWSDDGVIESRSLQGLLRALLPKQYAPEQVEREEGRVGADTGDQDDLRMQK
jgi:hypothetical protein